MTERKIFSVDRTEGEWLVCISDDDLVINLPRADAPTLEVRDVFSARVDGEKLFDIIPMPEERDRRLAENRARLHALARRNKK